MICNFRLSYNCKRITSCINVKGSIIIGAIRGKKKYNLERMVDIVQGKSKSWNQYCARLLTLRLSAGSRPLAICPHPIKGGPSPSLAHQGTLVIAVTLSHFHTFPAYWCHLRPSRGATRCHCCFLTSHKILKLKPYPFEVSQSEWRVIYPPINGAQQWTLIVAATDGNPFKFSEMEKYFYLFESKG